MERQRAALEPGGQGLALEELHDEIGRVFVLADVVEGADMRVIERRDASRLAGEPLAEVRVASQIRRQHLDRDRSVEARVADAPSSLRRKVDVR